MNEKLKLLLLESVEADAILIQRELDRAGLKFEARRVDSRQDFLRELAEFAPDLILADYSLPQFAVLEALQLLKAQPAPVPVILVTGSHSEEVAVECIKEGAEDYILKESLKRLPSAVRRVVEKRAGERAFRRSESRAEQEIAKLAAFVRFNPNPVLEFAADGALTYFNEAALALARSLQQDTPGSILPANAVAMVKLCLATGQSKLRHRTSLRGRTFSWSFFPVVASQTVHCYAEDITESLNMEMQLRQVQKMESVGQLAAGVAHDFNNILTIIQGHAGLMLSDTGLDALLADSARQISLAADRAANLTRQLLLFSRKQVMQPQLVDLNEVIGNISKMLRSLVGEPVTLRRNSAPDLPAIYADPGMIEQVLVNLVVNARDAMPKGGSITIETSAQEIDDAYVERKPEARKGFFAALTVSDSGHGMHPETLARVFEPFFTTKEVGKGTGLGLATVYGIVKQHQGWLEVESEVGRGTTFRMFMPASCKAGAARDARRAQPAPGGDETILLVEDELTLRELVDEVLRKKGYTVLQAASGAQALKVWQRHKDEIDLLLTDMMMPEGVSGRELAEQVLAERPELKVIYSSGYSLDLVSPGFVLEEGSNYLQKPYNPETLARAVRKRLDSVDPVP